jgi:hypothetical protein
MIFGTNYVLHVRRLTIGKPVGLKNILMWKVRRMLKAGKAIFCGRPK